ncbi:MAG: tellurium resistance protein TerC [Phycisphaerae bacterium]|nr:tellurium resistance protein TerC [Phycisphaerae bacterium]NNF44309.1 tellurium resistance protein TerC [Phycisphaerales bacterium]
MSALLNLGNLGDLAVLIFLQLVLGFDNLLYISIESKRAPAAKQAAVRRIGIIVAGALRVILLFVMVKAVTALEAPFFGIHWTGVLEGEFNFAALVFLLGGGFIMYTAVREIMHMLAIDDLEHEKAGGAKSAGKVVALIVLMNLIFSFDSILSAMAITMVFAVLTVAILVSVVLMLVAADHVAGFLQKHRKYEVLGLFILLIVGVVLLGEGGHVAHLKLFGYQVEAMSKTTFYFAIAVLFIVDILQSGYQKKLAAEREANIDQATA